MSDALGPAPAAARGSRVRTGRRDDVTLTPLGGAGTSVLVDTGYARVLVDCGASPDLAAFDAATLDAVVLTHAHPQHADGLAVLVRNGFAGALVATPYTLRMADIGLRDALLTQRENEGPAAAAQRAATHTGHGPTRPDNDPISVAATIAALGVGLEFGEPAVIAPGVACTLHRAGHALGSAWVRLDLGAAGTLAVSGDLGRHGHPLLRYPEPFTHADTVLVEAVYGEGRRPVSDDRDHLAHVMFTTLDRGGTVLVPAGPVDHIATVLYELARLHRVGCLPDGAPVCFDGPTGLEAVGVWRDALLAHDPELRDAVLGAGFAALDPGSLTETRAARSARGPSDVVGAVVVAGPHHGDGGRAARHLRELLPDARNAVLLQGRSPVGTVAHALARGATEVHIGNHVVPVRAKIAHLPGMTTHADAGEIIEWLGHGTEPTMTYVVHGSPGARTALRNRVRGTLGWHAEIPTSGRAIHLTAPMA